MIINFRYTYVRQAHLRSQGNQRLGYKHPGAQRGCFVQADLYGNPPASYHLRFQGSNGALSNPEGSLMACPQPYRSLMMPAQHFEPGDFTFRNRFGRAASQVAGCGEEREARSNEPIIDHTKQSWYFSNASSALTSKRQAQSFVNNIIIYIFISYCITYQVQLYN
ncbi:Hypothetical_protein [Hexamita inflata]|uniref:Hypothetical_protein n=1 Tax=Hexamita inflata TaxID=28002 RepID=A0AA86RVF0_9EUKA|nr:Hypothetical protein HINF_LOCUS66234 [Hexamita inflata]